jgi:hypothetical protein
MKTAIELKHFDHAEWIAKLKSYKNEIVLLEKRLQELTSGNLKKESLAQVEHFQNQFIVQKSNVNDILHVVKMDEKQLHYDMVMNPIALDRRKADDQPREKDLVIGFEKTMTELKSDFTKFANRGK